MKQKEILEYFIRDLNAIIADPISNPNHGGGKFILKIEADKTGGECNLRFIEVDKKLIIFQRSFGSTRDDENDVEMFLRHCYIGILRTILLTEDNIGNLKGIDERPINALSFKTLAKSGLSILP